MVVEISNKTLIGAKPLRISFSKLDSFIRVYDGTRYLVLFCPEKYYAICNRIRYLVGQESDMTLVYFCNYVSIKIDSCDSLPLEKVWILHNVCLMLKYRLSQFLIRIKNITVIIFSSKSISIN